MQLQNKEGALIDRCFEWNDSGTSCTMQKGLHILCENISYADIKGKAILVWYIFYLSKPDSSCSSKIYGDAKKGIMWYSDNYLPDKR